VIPTTWVARGGGHAGVRVFPALQRPKGYGIRCNMTRGKGVELTKGLWCLGRGGGRMATTTGGGEVGVLADSSLWCSSRPAGPPNQHVQVL
jgi:hypothetical protein